MADETPPLRPADLFDLTGQVALVTGASRGLGFAMARALAGAGAHVVMNARGGDALTRAEANLRDLGLSVEAMPFDVGDKQDGPRAIEAIVAKRGRLDILVSNVAATVRKPLVDQQEEEWQRVIDVALTAGWRLARHAVPIMSKAGYGRIVFISSIMALIGRPGVSAYMAAKAALEGFTRGLAVELAPKGINVNAIAPGYFLTDGNAPVRAENPDFEAWISGRTPMGRWGRPEELATAVLCLTSPASSYLTGCTVLVDGGMTSAI